MKWYIDVMINNYLNFNGRARRTEFWMFTLVHFIIIFLLLLLRVWPLFIIYILLTVIPAVGVGIRRLHDTGRSGWWVLLANSPLLFVYYYFMILEGDSGGNIYGESPKESYMDRIMKDVDIENDSNIYSSSTRGGGSINLSDLDPEKIFGNEAYVQIIIVVLIVVSIILSWFLFVIYYIYQKPCFAGFFFQCQRLDLDRLFITIIICMIRRSVWNCF